MNHKLVKQIETILLALLVEEREEENATLVRPDYQNQFVVANKALNGAGLVLVLDPQEVVDFLNYVSVKLLLKDAFQVRPHIIVFVSI